MFDPSRRNNHTRYTTCPAHEIFPWDDTTSWQFMREVIVVIVVMSLTCCCCVSRRSRRIRRATTSASRRDQKERASFRHGGRPGVRAFPLPTARRATAAAAAAAATEALRERRARQVVRS